MEDELSTFEPRFSAPPLIHHDELRPDMAPPTGPKDGPTQRESPVIEARETSPKSRPGSSSDEPPAPESHGVPPPEASYSGDGTVYPDGYPQMFMGCLLRISPPARNIDPSTVRAPRSLEEQFGEAETDALKSLPEGMRSPGIDHATEFARARASRPDGVGNQYLREGCPLAP